MKKRICLILAAVLLSFSCLVCQASEPEEAEVLDIVEEKADENGEKKDVITEDESSKQEEVTAPFEEQKDLLKTQNVEKETKEKDADVRHGWFWEDGWYYYNNSGQKHYGWLYLENKWYYLDGDDAIFPGKMASEARKEISGVTYFFNKSGVMQTGWIKKPEGWYYLDKSGAMRRGWIQIGSKWYYLDGDNVDNPGLMVSDKQKKIGAANYFFNKSGEMLIGWIYRSGGWYYADMSGAQKIGWVMVGTKWYYLDGKNSKYPGLMVANVEKKIGENYYYFNSSGEMLIGWVYRSGGWYYTDKSGAKQTDWIFDGGKWYYLDGNNQNYPGLMVANCRKKIRGTEYYFLKNGQMATGWYYDRGYFYLNQGGVKVSGWLKEGGVWYYLDSANQNYMSHDCWKKINGNWYYFNNSGRMATGWLYLQGKWYYMASGGNMTTGWQYVDGNWYYMYYENDSNGGPYGTMARNTTINGWKVGPNGAMLPAGLSNMSEKAQGYKSLTGYIILVDRSARKVGVFNGSSGNWNNLFYWDCTVGAPSTPTVSGVFHVGSKGYYFDSYGSRCFYYTQFYGNYLFHTVLCYKDGSIMDGRLGMALSHGCVRLAVPNAKWIYDYIPRGTTVVVY